MAEEQRKVELKMAADGLYLEEMFTDRRVGTIQRLTPVTRDGGPDQTRSVVYVGQTQVLTPAGGLPITFEIEATSHPLSSRNLISGSHIQPSNDRWFQSRLPSSSMFGAPR